MCKKKVWSARPTTNERVCLMIKWHACMIYTSRGTKDDESNVWMDVSKTFPASANRYHVDSQTNTTLSCYASTVGIAVASDNRGLRFESSHWQIISQTMCSLLTAKKTKIKKERPSSSGHRTCLILCIFLVVLMYTCVRTLRMYGCIRVCTYAYATVYA